MSEEKSNIYLKRFENFIKSLDHLKSYGIDTKGFLIAMVAPLTGLGFILGKLIENSHFYKDGDKFTPIINGLFLGTITITALVILSYIIIAYLLLKPSYKKAKPTQNLEENQKQ
ncbi:MAG: hypothetical protein ACK5MR_17305, partial [Cumulibacter sp.]